MLPIKEIVKGAVSLVDGLTTTQEEIRQLSLEEGKLEHQRLSSQTDINKEEAKHKSFFVAGWRPAIGWVGALAFAYQFIVYPLFAWLWSLAQAKEWINASASPPPVLDIGTLMSLVMGMLGVGVMRSYDKKQGVSTDSIGSISRREFRLRKKMNKAQRL